MAGGKGRTMEIGAEPAEVTPAEPAAAIEQPSAPIPAPAPAPPAPTVRAGVSYTVLRALAHKYPGKIDEIAKGVVVHGAPIGTHKKYRAADGTILVLDA